MVSTLATCTAVPSDANCAPWIFLLSILPGGRTSRSATRTLSLSADAGCCALQREPSTPQHPCPPTNCPNVEGTATPAGVSRERGRGHQRRRNSRTRISTSQENWRFFHEKRSVAEDLFQIYFVQCFECSGNGSDPPHQWTTSSLHARQ